MRLLLPGEHKESIEWFLKIAFYVHWPLKKKTTTITSPRFQELLHRFERLEFTEAFRKCHGMVLSSMKSQGLILA